MEAYANQNDLEVILLLSKTKQVQQAIIKATTECKLSWITDVSCDLQAS